MNAFLSQAVGVYGTVNKNMKYNLMKHVETTGKKPTSINGIREDTGEMILLNRLQDCYMKMIIIF
jgi:hypothetical protein